MSLKALKNLKPVGRKTKSELPGGMNTTTGVKNPALAPQRTVSQHAKQHPRTCQPLVHFDQLQRIHFGYKSNNRSLVLMKDDLNHAKRCSTSSDY